MIGLMKMETGRLKESFAEVDFADYYNRTGAARAFAWIPIFGLRHRVKKAIGM